MEGRGASRRAGRRDGRVSIETETKSPLKRGEERLRLRAKEKERQKGTWERRSTYAKQREKAPVSKRETRERETERDRGKRERKRKRKREREREKRERRRESRGSMDATPRGATLSRILRSISPLRSNTMPALRTTLRTRHYCTPATLPPSCFPDAGNITFPDTGNIAFPSRAAPFHSCRSLSYLLLPPLRRFPSDRRCATAPQLLPLRSVVVRPTVRTLPPLHNHEG